MKFSIHLLVVGITCALVFRADLHRRRLMLTRASGWHVLTALDAVCPAVTAGIVAALLMTLIPIASSQRVLPLYSPVTWESLAGAVVFALLWSEGRRQIQFQRPRGTVFGEWLILAGAYPLLELVVFGGWQAASQNRTLTIPCGLAILSGAVLLAAIVPPFVKKYEGLRILDRVAEQGEAVQTECTPPTPECPHPELWQMLDSQTSEVEVLDFLKSLVMTVKPHLVVETGTFLGNGTLKMAEGLKANGFGRIITIEYDPAIYAQAKQRIDASGLGNRIEYRNESSLESRIDGTIDLLYSDSHLATREQEIRRFLPQVDPRGLIVIHDASSHFQVVREAALRMEQEGLISIVMLPTPRGLVIAQRREGRK